MSTVIEINDPKELANHRLLWNALLAKTPGATFFQSLDWLEVYWRYFGRGQKLRVLIVSVDEKVQGILPLVLKTESTRVGPVRVLTYPLEDWGSFYGPIGPNPTATLWLGLKHVQATPQDWDLVDFRWVNPQTDRGRTHHAMQAVGLQPRRQTWSRTAVTDLSGTWDDYWVSRSRKWRRNVRRLHNRLSKQGRVTFVRYQPQGRAEDDGDPRWDLYDTCLKIARRSWQGQSTTGTTLCHASVQSFLRDVHAQAARAGAVDINLLKIDDHPIAFIYGYTHGGNTFAIRKGYDSRWSASAPGILLQRMALEETFRRTDGFADGFYDFGPGSLDSKRPWQTDTKSSYRHTHYSTKAARAQALRLKHWLLNRFRNQHVCSAG